MKIDDITYKFHWNKTYRFMIVLQTILAGIMALLYLAFIILYLVYMLKLMPLMGLLMLLMLSFVELPVSYLIYYQCSHAVSYMQITDDQIVIKRWMGPKLVIEKRNIMYIKPVEAQKLCEHTSPSDSLLHLYRLPERGGKGLSYDDILLGAPRLESRIYGKITRYCNNAEELCLVALTDGQKLLINYPKELLS